MIVGGIKIGDDQKVYMLVFKGNQREFGGVFEQSFTILVESLMESACSVSDNPFYQCIRISGKTFGPARIFHQKSYCDDE